jgi:diguanylate cyclase (GGDEF)-like protein
VRSHLLVGVHVLAVLSLLGVLGVVALGARVLVLGPVEAAFGSVGLAPAATREMLTAVGAFGAASLFAAAFMTLRLRALSVGAAQIAAGDYSMRIDVPPGGGVAGRIADSLNSIAATLGETHDAATTDKLTAVANRAALLARLFDEVERANRYGRPLSVAFVDIDHFKAVNDTYGHHAGDVVLRHVAGILASNVRASDFVGRYGGEEFMLVCTETEAEEAAAVVEKLRWLVQRERIAIGGGQTISVTISIGIAGGMGARVRFDSIVRDADAAMYSAKSLGRNQTYVFAEPDEDSRVPRAPISPEGRASAMEIGKAARDAAVQMLHSFVAPLPSHRGKPSKLVAELATTMARHLELAETEVERIRIASLLHDLGKIAVPTEILDKPAPLSNAEWQSVVQHPRIGQLILEQASALRDAVPIILHHHERYSGHGYPFGLRGQDIPIGARIVAIAEAYEAITNDRPYKSGVDHPRALAELRRHAGTQFDPELVSLFCEVFQRGVPDVEDAQPAPQRVTAPTLLGSGDTRAAYAAHTAEPEAEQQRVSERPRPTKPASAPQPLLTPRPAPGLSTSRSARQSRDAATG